MSISEKSTSGFQRHNEHNCSIGSKLEWQAGFLDPVGSMAVIHR